MIFSLWAARSLSAARRLTGLPSPTAESHYRATFYANRTTTSPFLTMDNHPRKTLPSSPTTFGAKRPVSAARRLTGSPFLKGASPSRATCYASRTTESPFLTMDNHPRKTLPSSPTTFGAKRFSPGAERPVSAARRLTGSPFLKGASPSRATTSPFLTMDNHPRKTFPPSPTTLPKKRFSSSAQRPAEKHPRKKISTSLLNEFQKLTRVSKERRMYPIERKNS